MWTILAAIALVGTTAPDGGVQTADSGQSASAPRESEVNAAVKAIQSGQSAEAIAILDPLLNGYADQYGDEKRLIFCAPNQTEAIAYMGIAGADPKHRGGIAIAADWCYALWEKGFALIDLGRIDDAVPYLKRAVAMAPMHSHFLSELGYAYQQLEKWDASYDSYESAADFADFSEARDAEIARAWRGMGYALIEQKKWDAAEAMYRKCLDLDANDAKAQSELRWIDEHRSAG